MRKNAPRLWKPGFALLSFADLLRGVGARGAVLAACALSVFSGGQALAATPAGTVIVGRSFAEYSVLGSADRLRAESNFAYTRVKGVQAGRIEPNLSIQAEPGQALVLVHRLRNLGNVDSDYALSLLQTSETRLIGAFLALDVNHDGVLDSGDRVIDGPLSLRPGEAGEAQILISGRISEFAAPGAEILMTLEARIVGAHPDVEPEDVGLIEPARDRISLIAANKARLTKSLGAACSLQLAAGDAFSSTILVQEAGRLAPYARGFVVDGVSARGVMIEEAVARDARPSSTAPEVGPSGAHALLGFGEGAATVWRSWRFWNGSDRPSKIGFFLPETLLTPGAEARMVWRVQALSAGPVAAFAASAVAFDAEGDGVFSGLSDLSTPSPCPPIPVAACFASAEGAFSPASFASSVDAALAAARSSLIHFAAETRGSSGQGETEAALIVHAPEAQTPGGELTAEIFDTATGDSLFALLTPVSGQPGYFAMAQALHLQRTDPSAERVGFCAAGAPLSCRLQSGARSRLVAQITAVGCSDSMEAEAMVGLGGFTFLAGDDAPLPEARVSFAQTPAVQAMAARTMAATTLAVSETTVVTDSNGFFLLPQGLPVGDYCVTAEKEGYAFPSASQAYGDYHVNAVIASGCVGGGVFRVEPARISVAGDSQEAIGLDLPFDAAAVPPTDQGLWIEKTASASSVQTGDFVRYEVALENRTGRRVSALSIRDAAAQGLAYAPGSLRVNGASPSAGGVWSFEAPNLNLFSLDSLEAGGSLTLSYVMRVGANASGELVNAAQAWGLRPDGSSVASEVSSARLRVERTGVLSDRNYLIGRVTAASSCEKLPPEIDAFGLEDEGLGALRLLRADGTLARPRVWPVAGARVWLETGVYAVTDERGYYSVYGLTSGPHVARLDGETTPRGLAPVSPRSAPSGTGGWSQFVNLRFGDLARADFHLGADCAQMEAVWPQIAPDPSNRRTERQLDEAVRFESGVRDLENELRSRARGDGDVGRGLSGDLQAQNSLLGKTEALVAENAAPQSRERAAMAPSEAAVATITAEMGRDGVWLWPKDGISRDGRFMAAIRAGAEPELYVNDVAVPQSQLGERLHNAEARAELVAWYGVQLRPGANRVEVRGRDPFGNARVLASGDFRRPGSPERLVLESDRLTLPADGGRSQAQLTLRLIDAEGIPTEGVSFATLHAEDGLWMTQDLDGSARGLQVRLEDGAARVVLASSERSGPVLVTVEGEDRRRAELELRFSADERPLMGIGLLAFEANFAGRGWRIPENLNPIAEGDRFGGAYDIGARGTVFLKGKIRGDALLTLLYDSSRREDDLLFRDLDPNAYYPVYGDGSVTGYEAQARSPLYVRLEKGGFMGMWGDFATDPESELKLGGLTRNLTGANVVYQNEDWRVQAFAARPDAATRSVELRGLGLAMGYRLPGAPLAGGTERISLIVRDRLNPGIVLSRAEMRRGSDFALDYDSGRLDFFSPVPSTDDDLNPIFIAAAYETQEAADPYTVAGARVERNFGETLRVGGAYSHVDDPSERNRLAAVYGEYRPAEDVRLRAEGAWSRNPDTGVTGTALLVEGEAKLGGGFAVEGGFGRAETGFQGESAAVSEGRMEARASVSGPLGDLAELRAQSVYSKDLAEDDWRLSAEAELRRPIGPVEGRLGVRHEQADTGGERTRQTFVTTGLQASTSVLGREVGATLEAARAVDSPAFRASGRLDVQASPDTTLYVKHEFANDDATLTGPEGDGYLSLADAFSQGRTVVGVENAWRPDTKIYSETRLTGSGQEQGVESAMGLRGDYLLIEGLTLQAQGEHVRAFSGEAEDSTAVSLALRDERREGQSRALRLESRVEEKDWTFGATAAVVGRVTEELTLLAAARYEGRMPETGFERHEGHVRLGLAFRPMNNRVHVLALYEAEYEKAASEAEGDALSHLLSTHLNAQLTDRLQFSGRVGARFTTHRFDSASYRSEVGLADMRVLYGLTDRLALEGRGGALTVGWGDSLRWSGGLGLNYAVTENLEVGLGYNFSGFREDALDPQGYNRQGVYMRLNLKFDEDLFNWLAAP